MQSFFWLMLFSKLYKKNNFTKYLWSSNEIYFSQRDSMCLKKYFCDTIWSNKKLNYFVK